MKSSNTYNYLDEYGKMSDLAKMNLAIGKDVFLVLDSSVCLDIVSTINKKEINKQSKRKVFELISQLQKSGVHSFDIFALLELCLDKTTFRIDTDKFFDLHNKLDFAFKCPVKKLKNKEFNYNSNYIPGQQPQIDNNANTLVDQILVHYCCLLKIRSIAREGLGKVNSKKNIINFLNWMNDELGLVMGVEYQLAIRIFGGNDDFSSMIKAQSTEEKSLKAIWGTAWDLFHARVSRNSTQLSKIVNQDIISIFITNDRRLYELLAPNVEFASKYDRSRITITDGIENYPPFYDETFMQLLNERVLDIFSNRKMRSPEYPSRSSVERLINSMIETQPNNV